MKKIIVFLVIFAFVFALCGCNKQIIDTNYNFEYAILELPNGEVVEGDIVSWTDYDDGDQIQVKIGNMTYLAHSSDIVLIHATD